jgi:two-component system, LytTR family, sensor kinase
MLDFQTMAAGRIPRYSVTKKEVLLFVGFYVLSTLVYYTATWITWGGLEGGHSSFFDIEEFFAAAGTDFIISFILTVPIWHITVVVLQKHSYRLKYALTLILMPIFVLLGYNGQYIVKNYFGWAMFWGGTRFIWTLYNLMLFYAVQFAIIHAYNYFKQFKRLERERYELNEAVIRSELTALKAQLNPHFLHNLFNSINASIPPVNERARELVISMSNLFRYQNYAAQRELVSVKEEVDFIVDYLQLMKVRLKSKLTYEIDLPEELYSFKVAPMLLQPLVENAVTHGIACSLEPASLFIKVSKNEGKIAFTIADTGVGMANKEAAMQKGIGLKNTRERLKKMYHSEMAIEDNWPRGTKISFAI